MQTIFLDWTSSFPKNYTGSVEWPDGAKFWYKEGKYHRLDGPAIEWADGDKQWLIEGNLHREDGPAIEHLNGTKYWYKDGDRHREDGPACEYADGEKDWWIENKKCFDMEADIIDNYLVLDVLKHPKYPLVKIIKFLDKDILFERIVVIGMRLYSKI